MRKLLITDRIVQYSDLLNHIWNSAYSKDEEYGSQITSAFNQLSAALWRSILTPDKIEVDDSFLYSDSPCEYVVAIPKTGQWNLAPLRAGKSIYFSEPAHMVPYTNSQVVFFCGLINYWSDPISHSIAKLKVIENGGQNSLGELVEYPLENLDFYLFGEYLRDA